MIKYILISLAFLKINSQEFNNINNNSQSNNQKTNFTSTNTWTDHYSLSITPSSTSSKILILSTNPVGITGSTPMRGALRLLRDTTNIYNTLDCFFGLISLMF